MADGGFMNPGAELIEKKMRSTRGPLNQDEAREKKKKQKKEAQKAKKRNRKK
jgi:hypothetical protein